jgi:hypothetical protein
MWIKDRNGDCHDATNCSITCGRRLGASSNEKLIIGLHTIGGKGPGIALASDLDEAEAHSIMARFEQTVVDGKPLFEV